MTPTMPNGALTLLLDLARVRALGAGVFGAAHVLADSLECEASGASAPAWYQLFLATDRAGRTRLWVALVTPDRWLSQSIEQDLVHTGDTLAELMDEELAEQGYSGTCEPFEHFRDEQKRFIFRTPVPVDPERVDASGVQHAVDAATKFLLALEAMFRPLGDMQGAEE